MKARGRLPIARSYLLNTANVSNIGHISAEEYGEFSVRSLDEYGKDLGYWVVRGSAGAAICGVPLAGFKNDIDEILSRYPKNGEKVASWFASGYAGLGEAKKPLLKEVEIEKGILATIDPRNTGPYNLRLEFIEQAEQRAQEVDNYQYKDSFLTLVNALGVSGGIFLSRAINSGPPAWKTDDLPDLVRLPNTLLAAKEILSKAALSKTLWFGPRFFHRPKAGVEIVEDCVWATTEFGERVMLEGLLHSVKRISRNGDARGLVLPHGMGKLLSGDNDPEGSWQSLLETIDKISPWE